MKNTFRRCVGLSVTLALALSMGITARAAVRGGLCIHHAAHTESCGNTAAGICSFVCTDCEQPPVELKATDAAFVHGDEYPYTGEEVRPQVTVMAGSTLLVEGEQYTLTYADNIGVGTGTVTVTGMEAGGYTGTVTLPFRIVMAPGTPEFTLVEIRPEDVTVSGTEFPYTGGAIEPQVTVTVEEKELIPGKDYTLRYENNVEPGTATLTVSGIATASQTLGYTGEVTVEFTVLPPEETGGDQTPDDGGAPEQTPPSSGETPDEETTPGEETVPDDGQTPEEEAKPDYRFTSGSGSRWSQNSGKDLIFTVNGDTDAITEIRIDNKPLDSSAYALGKEGRITLKNSWLKNRPIGTYGISVVFADGQARGNFRVTAPVDPSNPSTGDGIGLWIAGMVLSFAGAAAMLPALRKRS